MLPFTSLCCVFHNWSNVTINFISDYNAFTAWFRPDRAIIARKRDYSTLPDVV